MERRTTDTVRIASIGGLLAAAGGIFIAKAAGMDMPPVPPGAVLLVVGAGLLALLRQARWPAAVGVLVAAAEVVASSFTLGDLDGAGQTVGTVVRLVGAVTAVVGCVAVVARRRISRRPAASAA